MIGISCFENLQMKSDKRKLAADAGKLKPDNCPVIGDHRQSRPAYRNPYLLRMAALANKRAYILIVSRHILAVEKELVMWLRVSRARARRWLALNDRAVLMQLPRSPTSFGFASQPVFS